MQRVALLALPYLRKKRKALVLSKAIWDLSRLGCFWAALLKALENPVSQVSDDREDGEGDHVPLLANWE